MPLWYSPEDQGFWALAVLTAFGAAAAVVRPESDPVVNRSELTGVGVCVEIDH